MKPPSKTPLLRTAWLYLRMVGLAWEANPWLAVLSFITILLSGAAAPLQVWLSKRVIDQVSSLVTGSAGVTAWQDILVPLVLYLVMWALSQVSQSLSASVNELIATSVHYHSLRRIVQKAASLDVAFFETPALLDQMTWAKNGTRRLEDITYQVAAGLTQLVTLLVMLYLLGRVEWFLPFILILAAMPKILISGRLSRRYPAVRSQQVPLQRMSTYLAQLVSDRPAAKEIRLFGLHDHLLKRHADLGQQYFRNMSKVVLESEGWMALLSVFPILGTAGIWARAGQLALAQQIGLGDVALVLQAVESSRVAIEQVAVASGRISANTLYLEALFGFLDLSPRSIVGALARPVVGRPGSKEEPVCNTKVNGMGIEVEFSHVTFCYPGSQTPVLQDVSFRLEPGQSMALVGENGAGKTTLVKLLARLYDPSEGDILINGIDLRRIEPQSYYRQTGVIFQDFAHYDLTARENIGFGCIDAEYDLDRVRAAAQMGGALAMIEELPDGFETVLGKRFEGGKDLSGGEWQKIALGRAFMRQSNLLILDEPTAALDAYAESEVYNRFAGLTRGKTTLFVTHRLSSVKMAQRIVVLKDGRIVEMGSHSELLEKDGEYARMFRLQAEKYQRG